MDEAPQSPPSFYGAVVRVRDLVKLRAFYRDVVKLGAPVVDSNFWVEFRLPGGGVLALEHCPSAEPGGSGRGNVSWLLLAASFDELVKQLKDAAVPLARPPLEVPGRRCATYADPEGNPFTVYGLERKT